MPILNLIAKNEWQQQVANIEKQMHQQLEGVETLTAVKALRVLGAVGVIEINHSLSAAELQPLFTELGVWIRVFGSIIYIMPPYTISPEQLTKLTSAMKQVAEYLSDNDNSNSATFISHG